MDSTQSEKLSFLDLARFVILGEKRALTTDEIWDIAEEKGLIQKLHTSGKTPKATLGAQLYTQAKRADGLFNKVSSRPARFVLRDMLRDNPHLELTDYTAQEAKPVQARNDTERQLHPVMVWFAEKEFGAHCRTVIHEKSTKRGPKHNQWLHPDIVGFSLTTESWKTSVVRLAKASGSIAAKLYSFELKIAIDFSTLREYFFQAVSNSSWAHEGYLVAATINDDTEFREELTRLSQSFGIGVIHLDLEVPLDSKVLLPARGREELDWDTINRIASINPDFTDLIECVAKSVEINQAAPKNLDPVLSEEQVAVLAKKLLEKLQ